MDRDLQKTLVLREGSINELQPLLVGSDEPRPKAEHSLVAIASVDDEIVGTISAERVWMVSNFQVQAALRGSGTAEALARFIGSMNVEGLTEMLCTTNPHVELLAHRFGFIPVLGTLFRH